MIDIEGYFAPTIQEINERGKFPPLPINFSPKKLDPFIEQVKKNGKEFKCKISVNSAKFVNSSVQIYSEYLLIMPTEVSFKFLNRLLNIRSKSQSSSSNKITEPVSQFSSHKKRAKFYVTK